MKNAIAEIIYAAVFMSCAVIICCVICIVFPYFYDGINYLKNASMIGASVIAGIWGLALIAMLFGKTVVVTENEIRMYRGKKLKWEIKKEDIDELIYTPMPWYAFLSPLSTINGFALQFKLKGKGIVRQYCSLSRKQVRKIAETFDYPMRKIQTVYEQ